MESTRYHECLTADFTRLRDAVARADPDGPVPGCPGWSVTDLVRHVAAVYLHKAESMRRGAFPDPWPPDLSGEPPLATLDGAYAQLMAEFDARPATARTAHWYEPDPTVGCLLRRMAQETVVHRVDAERAAGETPAPVPDDLAVDGVDEVLTVMVSYLSGCWPEEFDGLPADGDAPPVRVQAGPAAWLVTPTPSGAAVVADGSGSAAATVSADPGPMLLWLWGRLDDPAVTVTGDAAEVTRLRSLLHEATQ